MRNFFFLFPSSYLSFVAFSAQRKTVTVTPLFLAIHSNTAAAHA